MTPASSGGGSIERSAWAVEFEDDFAGPSVDESKWLPLSLPHRSGRDAARARYALDDGRLTLTVEPMVDVYSFGDTVPEPPRLVVERVGGSRRAAR